MSDTEVCQLLFNAIHSRESNLADKVQLLDGEIFKLLPLIGLQLMSIILSYLSSQLTPYDLEKGYQVHRHIGVKYGVLFGPIEVESPYMWNRQKKQGTPPVKNQLGITDVGRSPAKIKAMAAPRYAMRDWYLWESINQQAAKQFEQHYGWNKDRYRVIRAVAKIAPLAEEYVSQRLERSRAEDNKPLDVKQGVENILVELDGCAVIFALVSFNQLKINS